VRLDGWNFVPRGYGLVVEARGGPLWLRALLRAPVVDRFGYPLAVRRGVFCLYPIPDWPADDTDEVPDGWTICPESRPLDGGGDWTNYGPDDTGS
jgi:hypothetical protein